MEKLIFKILDSNFLNSIIKIVYLHDELFISILKGDEFLLFGVSYKGEKFFINKYREIGERYGKILFILIKKYEKLFVAYFKFNKENIYKIGEESDFINIYSKRNINLDILERELYFTFLDDYSYRRRSDMHFIVEDKSFLEIYHSDFECSQCTGPKHSFINFSTQYNDNDIYEKEFFGDNSQLVKKLYLNTNITAYESITNGGNEKINEILSNEKLIKKYDIIAINKTCLSVIMGDDIESILKYNNIPLEKIIYTDQNIGSGYKAIVKFLKRLNIIQTKKNNNIIFFGLNKNKNTFEIIQFLERNFGIKVGNVLLPNINKKDLENIFGYKLAVFFVGKEIKTQNIFKLYPIDTIEVKIPYSLFEIYSLYKNILNFFNMSDLVDKLNIIFEKKRKDNSKLFHMASTYSLGFIIYDFHIIQFLNNNFRGCSILSILNNMGFKLNFFIYSKNNKYKNDIDNFKKISIEYNYNLIISDKKIELDHFIMKKNIKLYYSEIANDKRILSKNKGQFSVGDFEYGIDGFYRSMELLLKKCEKVDYINTYL